MTRAWSASTTWRALLPLGFSQRALATSEEAIAEARRLAHQNSLALPLFFGRVLRQILGDRAGVEALSEELARIAAGAGFRFWQASASILRGWTLADAGEGAAGGLEIRRGIDQWRATGAEYMVPYFLALLARAELATGHSGAALKLLDEARARVERTCPANVGSRRSSSGSRAK